MPPFPRACHICERIWENQPVSEKKKSLLPFKLSEDAIVQIWNQYDASPSSKTSFFFLNSISVFVLELIDILANWLVFPNTVTHKIHKSAIWPN